MSIPGVAIAVALMPPLGVTGYGIAVALSLNTDEGMRVALGGGLLFLTNLVAITFTAMIVFLVLHIDVPSVQEQREEWQKSDTESTALRHVLGRLPGVAGFRHIGALPERLLMILIIILVILIPLGRSFNQLKTELARQKKENGIRQVVTETWRNAFGKLPSGETRSFLDQTLVADHDGKLTLQLRALTSKPLTSNEKEQFNRTLEARLATPRGSLETQIVEIPTAAAAMGLRVTAEQPRLPPSVAQLQANLFERIDRALTGLYLPLSAQFMKYQLTTKPPDGLDLTLSYLGDHDLEPDAQALIQQDVRTRLDYAEAMVRLIRFPVSQGQLRFRGRDSSLDRAGQEMLDNAAGYCSNTVNSIGNPGECRADSAGRVKHASPIAAIKDYLSSHSQIADRSYRTEIRGGNANAWPESTSD